MPLRDIREEQEQRQRQAVEAGRSTGDEVPTASGA
jgi:hypothetical protein